MAMSDAERKANQRERDAKRGIVQFNTTIHESWYDDVMAFAAKCRTKKPVNKTE